MLPKGSYFCLKNLVPLTGLERSYGYPCYQNPSRKNQPAIPMNPTKFLKDKESRGEILESTDPASPFDRAHMNRP